MIAMKQNMLAQCFRRFGVIGVFLLSTVNFLSGNEETVLHRNKSLEFIENKGQIVDISGNVRSDILFFAEAAGMNIYLQKNGFSYVVYENKTEEEAENILFDRLHKTPQFVNGVRVDVCFLDADVNVQVIKENRAPGSFNYFLEHCPEGIKEAGAYYKIVYKNIYSNIDIVFSGGGGGGLKYDFVVNPGGDSKKIKMNYHGIDALEQNQTELIIKTPVGVIKEVMPKVYQNINGDNISIGSAYQVNGNIVGINLEKYNPKFSVVIDPWITYYGGNDRELSSGITNDANGDVLVVGMTESANFPVTAGTFQSTKKSAADVFIFKFNPSGTRLWSTFYGGTNYESGYGIATDALNNVLITGYTKSSNLPVPGAYQSAYAGAGIFGDAFVAKFNSAGNSLLWASFFGGNDMDAGMDIVADNSQNVFITGYTSSSNFPVLLATQGTKALGSDAFVAKFSSTGTLLWSTFYGGEKTDEGHGIDIDNNNNVLVSGWTSSVSFPVVSAFQSSNAGISDMFVLKMNNSGTPQWATYYGGPNTEYYTAEVTTDSQDNVIVTGYAEAGFPTTAGAFQPAHAGGNYDAYIVKFDKLGNRLWATYLGGSTVGATSGNEEGFGVAVDAKDNIYVGGDTYAKDFPVTSCSYQTSFNGAEDNYLAKFDPSGKLICSGYVGGAGHDEILNAGTLSVNGGFVYLTGYAPGSFPVTAGAYDLTFNGGFSDVTVMQLCENTCGLNNLKTDFNVSNNTICVGTPVNFFSVLNTCDTADTKYLWTFSGAVTATSTQQFPSNIVYNTPGSYAVKLVVYTPCGNDSIIKNAYVNVIICSCVNPPILTVTAATDAYCGAFNGSASVSVSTGGTSPFTYSWVPLAATSSSLTGLAPGNYSVIVTDAAGCNDTVSFLISAIPGPTVTTTHTNVNCHGDARGSITAVVSGGTLPVTYQWNTGDTGSNISGLTAGNYTLLVTDANNCTSFVAITISEPPPVTLNITQNNTSCGLNNGQGSVIANGGVGGYRYSWSTTPVLTTASVSGLSAGTYSITVTDSNSCVVTGLIQVAGSSAPNVSFIQSDSSGCPELCITFTAIASPGVTYLWNFGDGSPSTNSTEQHCYTISGIYSVSLTVTDLYGCSATKVKNNLISVFPKPTAAFTSNPGSPVFQNTTVYFDDLSSGATSWLWSFGDTDSSASAQQNPEFTYSVTGSHTVKLVVYNDYGCFDTASKIIEVFPDYSIYIPNTFTPNGDGVNDLFFPKGTGINTSQFEMYIFDRWGNLIYKTTDINKGWDGRANGGMNIAQIDTYVWKIVVRDLYDQRHSYTGHVNLIK